MLRLRCCVASLGLFALASACTTTPQYSRSAPRSSSHETPRAFSADALYLCRTGVTNAPATRPNGAVAGFTPYVQVNETMIARAPVAGCVSSGFGPRVMGGVGKFHNGIDLYTKTPAPVYAGGDGGVEEAKTVNGYGNMILIRHNSGVKTRYAHLSSFSPRIKRGANVRGGETIGQTGSTGNATAVHLHYEIIAGGVAINPLK